MGLNSKIKILDRFLAKVQVGPLPVEWTGKPEDRTECLLWIAAKDSKGYGRFWDGHRVVPAHIFIYKKEIKDYSSSLDLDHLCRVRHCVNSLHLEPVTRKENCNRSELLKKIARLNGIKTGSKNGLLRRKNNLPKGIYLNISGNFQVRKYIKGKSFNLGTYSALDEALEAYNEFIELRNKLKIDEKFNNIE